MRKVAKEKDVAAGAAEDWADAKEHCPREREAKVVSARGKRDSVLPFFSSLLGVVLNHRLRAREREICGKRGKRLFAYK